MLAEVCLNVLLITLCFSNFHFCSSAPFANRSNGSERRVFFGAYMRPADSLGWTRCDRIQLTTSGQYTRSQRSPRR
jgi:hypothetical protein